MSGDVLSDLLRAVRLRGAAFSFILGAYILGALALAPLQAQGQFTLSQSVPLPGVEGRIDHMAIDLSGGRLFVAALGNDSLEVVDVRSFTVAHHIGGLSEPQGVAYLPELNKLYVANGGTGLCNVYDGSTYALVKHIDLGGDADNIHYAAASRQLVVSSGNGLSLIDAVSDTLSARVDLPGHPEGFAVEQKGPHVFANVPLSRGRTFVIDRQKAVAVGQWHVGVFVTNMLSNFPLFLDDADKLLFVGTRAPPRMHVISSEDGRALADVGIDGDPDDIFYDARRHAAYISCGEGYIDVVVQRERGRYSPVTRVLTAPGARTSLWVPELDQLFVAVPHRGDQRAEIRIYTPVGS